MNGNMDWGKIALDLSKKLLVALATGAANMAVGTVMNKLLDGGGTPKTIGTTATEPETTTSEETTD